MSRRQQTKEEITPFNWRPRGARPHGVDTAMTHGLIPPLSELVKDESLPAKTRENMQRVLDIADRLKGAKKK